MIEEAVYSLLSGDATVAGLVGTRIYPAVIPEGVTADCIRTLLVSDVPTQAMHAASGLARARMQVEAQSDTYAGASTLRNAIRDALGRYRGTSAGLVIQDVFRESGQAVWDDSIRRYVLSDDYLLMYLEG